MGMDRGPGSLETQDEDLHPTDRHQAERAFFGQRPPWRRWVDDQPLSVALRRLNAAIEDVLLIESVHARLPKGQWIVRGGWRQVDEAIEDVQREASRLEPRQEGDIGDAAVRSARRDTAPGWWRTCHESRPMQPTPRSA